MCTCAFSWEHIILLILLRSDSILRLISRQEFAFFNTLAAGTGKLNYKYFTWLSMFCKTDMRMYVAIINDTLSNKNLSLRQCLNFIA